MDKEKLKEKLHEYIHNLEYENALLMLHEVVVENERLEENDILDELTPEQEARLQESIKQLEEGKTNSHEEVLNQIALWRSK